MLNRSVVLNVALLYLFVLLQGWTADLIKGDALFEWSGRHIAVGQVGGNLMLATMACVSGLLALWLYRRRDTYLPVRVIDRRGDSALQAKPCVVVSLSPSDRWFEPRRRVLAQDEGDEAGPLPESLHAALSYLSELRPRWNGEVLLRGLAPHASVLEAVYLIPSPESSKRIESAKGLIRDFFPRAKVHQLPDVSVSDLDGLLDAFALAARRWEGSPEDMVIDVTSGSKLASIAAALFTLQHPKVAFQYVNGNAQKDVLTFNVGSQREAEA